MEYYSAIKKNKRMPLAATWIDIEMIILSEGSLKQKDKYHMILFYMKSKQYTNELIYETEIDSQT